MSQYDLMQHLKIKVGLYDLYITWFSGFALYLEGYLTYKYDNLGLWVSMIWCFTSK